MTRRWIKFQATGSGGKAKAKKLKQIEERFDQLNVRRVFKRLCFLDNCYGRAHLYIDTGNRGSLLSPLIVDDNRAAKVQIRTIRAIEPMWCYPAVYNAQDPLLDTWYRPDSWYVMGRQIHASRFLTFISREVPDILKPAYAFGGLSTSQMSKPYIDNWLRTRQSVSDLVHSFSVSGIKTDMSTILQGGGAEQLELRASLFGHTRDNRGVMMLQKGYGDDPGEEFFNVSTPLSGVSELQAQSQEQMSSINQIPLVVYLGITPSGLNASSDGEIRTFYTTKINSDQNDFIRPHLTTIFQLVQLELFGQIDPELSFDFVPLWQPDEEKLAAIQKTKADTREVDINTGAIDADEARQAIAGDAESQYQGLDLSGPAPGPPAMDDPETAESDDVRPAGTNSKNDEAT